MTLVTRWATALTVLLALVLLAAPPVRADESPLVGQAVTGDPSRATTLVPVPDGLVLRRLLADLHVSSPSGGAPAGRLELLVGGRRVRTLPARTETSIRTEVRRSDVDASGMLPVGLRWVGACPPPGLTATLDDLRLVHGGREVVSRQPARFLDDAVTRVDVVVPRTAPDDLLEAALDAVAALSRSYPDGVHVSMETADAVLPRTGAGQRVLRLQPGPERAPRVTSRFGLWTLTLQGEGRSVASSVQALLGRATTVPTRRATQTLAVLGAPQVALSGWGTSTARVAVPQDVFGGAPDAYDLRLVGTRSAVPPGTRARLDVRFDGLLVHSVDLARQQDTDADVRVTIPASAWGAEGELEVSLTAVPPGGCAAGARTLPVEVNIDGARSTLTADLAEPTGAAFQQVPSSLGGRVQVALRPTGTDRAAAAAHAALLVAAMQRVSGLPLDISLVRVSRLVTGSRPGILVGATAADTRAVRAPVRMEAGGGVGALPDDEDFAALQVVRHRGRDLVLVGSWSAQPGGAAGLARTLVSRVAGHGWASLEGNAVLQPASGRVVSIDAAPPPRAGDQPPPADTGVAVYLVGAAGIMLLLLLVQVGLVIRKDRRVRSGRSLASGRPQQP